MHSFSFLHFLKTPDNPKLNKRFLRNFEKILAFVQKCESYNKISEKDLANVKVYSEDSEKSIIKTKGFFRQIWYSFWRLIKIRNGKAKKLMTAMLIGLGILLVGAGVILWRVLL